jgi:hypothetical protein
MNLINAYFFEFSYSVQISLKSILLFVCLSFVLGHPTSISLLQKSTAMSLRHRSFIGLLHRLFFG